MRFSAFSEVSVLSLSQRSTVPSYAVLPSTLSAPGLGDITFILWAFRELARADAGLTTEEHVIIAHAFDRSAIRINVATSSLAFGINFVALNLASVFCDASTMSRP